MLLARVTTISPFCLPENGIFYALLAYVNQTAVMVD